MSPSRWASGAGVQIAFAAAMVVFALEEALRSPAVTGEAASPEAGGRSPGPGTLACMAGALLGPAVAGMALGAGWATSLLTTLAVACSGASVAARRLSRYLPPVAGRVPAASDRGLAPGGRVPAANERTAEANERIFTASERVAAMSERWPAAGVRGLAGVRGAAAGGRRPGVHRVVEMAASTAVAQGRSSRAPVM